MAQTLRLPLSSKCSPTSLRISYCPEIIFPLGWASGISQATNPFLRSSNLPPSPPDPGGSWAPLWAWVKANTHSTANLQTVFKLLLRPLFLLLLVPISSLKIFKPHYSQQDQINIPQLPLQKEPIKASKSSLAGTKNLRNGALLPALFSSSCSKLLGWFFSHCAPSTSPSFY